MPLTRRSMLKSTSALALVGVACGGEDEPPTGPADAGMSSSDAAASFDAATSPDAGAVGGSDASVMDAGATPSCPFTEDNALGPAYVPNAPFRTELNVLNWPGTPLTISGTVMGPDCTPLAGAVVDVWQADDDGNYDGSPLDPDGDPAPEPDYPLRGRIMTDANGRYSFSTIFPGLYTGRTRHIHARINKEGFAELITQIYFSNVPENAIDGLIETPLIIDLDLDGVSGVLSGTFDVVLRPL